MVLKTLAGLRLEGSGFRRPKPLLLLCYLAMEGPKSRRYLAELFFPWAKDPRDSLTTMLRQLRRAGEGAIETENDRVWTELPCDASGLLTAIEEGHVQAAVGAYCGPFLDGFGLDVGEELEEWIYGTREFLGDRVREMLVKQAETEAARGDFKGAAHTAERALVVTGAGEPALEVLERLYACLLAGGSVKAAALQKEAQEFGLTMVASREVTQQRFLEAGTAAVSGVPNNLQLQPTSFVGRDPELTEIAELLDSSYCRLLTLHGPGGVGKSRLAIQAAFEQVRRGSFQDGVFFVALDALTTAEQIPGTIANALSIDLAPKDKPLERVKAYLGQKRLMVVLDGFEQLLDEATLPVELIEACPNLRVLVTSRELLNVAEEHVLTLDGLPLPVEDAGYAESVCAEALQLLVQRAKKARLDFHLSPEVLPVAVRICHVLGGSPLGIELAMAWIKLMRLEEILAEITRNLDFLESSTRNVRERHRSLRAVFEHSWELLNPRGREVLRKLAVFRGGFRREAASAVAGATLPILASLVDRSFLKVLANGRYDWHALLHRFTVEKLAEQLEEQVHTEEQYAGYYQAMAEEAEPLLEEAEQVSWVVLLEEEHNNLRAVLEWALQTDRAELGLHLTGSLGRFWQVRGLYREGRDWFERFLAHPMAAARTRTRAKALAGGGWLTRLQSDYAAARPLLEESLAISRELDYRQGIARALHELGALARDTGDYSAARPLLEESLVIRQELGGKRDIGNSLSHLGRLASDRGDFAAARSFLEKSLAIARELRHKAEIGYSLIGLGAVAATQGDYPAAHSHFEESLSHYWELGDRAGMAFSLEEWAIMEAAEGLPERAARLWGAAEALRAATGSPIPPVRRDRHDREVAGVLEQLGETGFSAAWEEGRRVTVQEAVSYVLGETVRDAR